MKFRVISINVSLDYSADFALSLKKWNHNKHVELRYICDAGFLLYRELLSYIKFSSISRSKNRQEHDK